MREASVGAATVLSRACRFLLLGGLYQDKISGGGRRKIWFKYRELFDCVSWAVPRFSEGCASVVLLFGQVVGLCMDDRSVLLFPNG